MTVMDDIIINFMFYLGKCYNLEKCKTITKMLFYNIHQSL